MKNLILIFTILFFVVGCANVFTFPTIARKNDTVALMIGGSEDARKESISAILTDVNETEWDLQALGLIRSVFSVRPDGRAEGLYYSAEFDIELPWLFGHEPVQTVLVVDLPDSLPAGNARIEIDTNTDDNSAGVSTPYTLFIEIIPGTGSPDPFLYRHPINGDSTTQLEKLEPAPHAKITFGVNKTEILGAASLVVDFNEATINPNDIAVYTPNTTARSSGASFDDRQHNLFWKQDGDQLHINIISPTGIQTAFLNIYIVHPDNLTGTPDFSITSSTVYDTNGNEVFLQTNLEYFP